MRVGRTLIGLVLACAAGGGCFSSSDDSTATPIDSGPSPQGDGEAPVIDATTDGPSVDATTGTDAGPDVDSASTGDAALTGDGGSASDGGCGGDGGSGSFSCTGGLNTPRSAVGGAALGNGKVLVAGGWNTTSKTLASAEVFDEATGTFTTTGPMGGPHLWAGWASPWPVLDSGKVLTAGGLDATGALLPTAELYDPVGGMFASTGGLSPAVVAFNAVKLQDGSVLFIGGYSTVTVAPPTPSFQYTAGTNQVQRYDPTSGMFGSAGTLAEARLFGCNVLLPSGKVLAIGGWQGVPTAAESNIEVYDPAMNQWSTAGTLSGGVTCSANAFNLPGGAVLLDSSQLLDPVALTTTPTTNTLAIANATFVQLANGDVLAFGGQISNMPAVEAQVYRNATGLWTTVGSMHEARQGTRGFLMSSGDVLVVGGADANGSTLSSAEIYHP
jgi:large repetitive protein